MFSSNPDLSDYIMPDFIICVDSSQGHSRENMMVSEDRKHCEYVIKIKSSISNDDTYLETIL